MQAGEGPLTRDYWTEGELATAKVSMAMQPEWVGCSVSSEAKRSQSLREAVVEAQRTVLNLLQSADRAMDDLRIRWIMEDDEGSGWFWNPSIVLSSDVVTLICEARCIYV